MHDENFDNTALKLSSVSKRFSDSFSLVDISMTMEKGRSMVILGPSGSGKTSLLRLIAGFVPIDSGLIEVGGKTANLPKKIIMPPRKRKMGMVFQNLALWTHLSVEENLLLCMKKGEDKKRKLKELLSWAQLEGYDKKRPNELSGGEQQRLALARALAGEPEILLLDEPLRSLDRQMKDKILDWIGSIRKSLTSTILYVTHDIKESRVFSDHVIVLDNGEILQRGKLEEIRKWPVNDRVKNLLVAE
jgi:ABC-type Fe3+/spermidine/putrescine transport system ATPase subunit